MQRVLYQEYTVVTGGLIETIPVKDRLARYRISGTAAITGNISFSASGTPVGPLEVVIEWIAEVTVGSGSPSVTLFGLTIDEIFWDKNFMFRAIWNGSAWVTQIFPDFSDKAFIKDADIVASTSTSDGIQLSKLRRQAAGAFFVGAGTGADIAVIDGSTPGRIPQGNGTTMVMVPISGDATLASGGALTLANNAATFAKFQAAAAGRALIVRDATSAGDFSEITLTDGSFLMGDATGVGVVAMSGDVTMTNAGVATIGAATVEPTMLDSEADKDRIVLNVSFASGRVGAFYTVFNIEHSFTIDQVDGILTEAMGATDAGSITLDIGGVNVSGVALSFAAATAAGNTVSETPSGNNTFAYTGTPTTIGVTTVKSTANGGEMQITISLTRD